MNTVNASMTVIGAGSYGTALAITLARNGHAVVLWGHNPAQIQTLQQDRCNQAFLPDVPFPDTLLLEADLARALAASRDVLVVVPSHVFGDVLRQLKPHLRPDARIVWATKGLEAETGRLLQDVAREALGETIPLAVLSGPTFAKELAAGLPTAIALAATDAQFADDLQQLLHCGKSFRVYSNPDFIGVQLGGAVKNVIAIGAGMSDGIGFGANARTALRIAMLGIPPSDMSIDWNQVIFKGLFIKGIYGREMFETWYKMAALIQSGLDLTPIITHRFSIDEFQQGFDAMRSGKSGKVVLSWD